MAPRRISRAVYDIVLDGEAMAHCKDGLPDFHGLRSEDGGADACLFAFVAAEWRELAPSAAGGASGTPAEDPTVALVATLPSAPGLERPFRCIVP